MVSRILLFSLLVFGLFSALSAQPIRNSTPEAMRRVAEEDATNGNDYEALELFKEAYDDLKDKELLVKIAFLEYKLRDFEAAEKAFFRLTQRDRKKEFTELKFWYARSLHMQGKYLEAKTAYQDYLSEAIDPKQMELAKTAIPACEAAQKAKQPENLIVVNAGKKVNSPQTQSSPQMAGGQLYFATMDAKQVVVLDGKEDDSYFSKIAAAPEVKPGEYGEPVVLDEAINREGWHQGNVHISPDGQSMFFTRVELKNNVVGTSKIFYSEKTNEGWAGAEEVTGVNGDHIAKHPCVGELFGAPCLFFVADLPGGKGGFDLYYAPKKGEGQYGTPVALVDLNTAGDEVSPFYRDGKLWFSSDGHGGLGGLDIMFSTWNGSNWSRPQLLEKGYNSSVDDQYFTLNQTGYTGFFVSNRPGPNNLKSKTCCDDVYAFEIEQIKANLNALTFDQKTKKPLPNCTVRVLEVLGKGTNPFDEKKNPTANLFDFGLATEKQFLIIASRDGYYSDSTTVNTVGLKKTQTFEKKLNLRAIPPPPPPKEEEKEFTRDEPIRLNNIYYDYNDYKILPDAEEDLQQLYDLMIQYADMVIELSSHTDARGNDAYNQSLSQKRAESAKAWLVAKGIATERISPVGYGEKVILNQCQNGVQCSDEDHRYNRRTEFKITAGPTSIKIKVKKKAEAEPQKAPAPKPKTTTGGKQSAGDRFFFQQN